MAAPFTYTAYRELLQDYRAAGYKFGSFQDVPWSGAPLVLMRHDIDFDLGAARLQTHIDSLEDSMATNCSVYHKGQPRAEGTSGD